MRCTGWMARRVWEPRPRSPFLMNFQLIGAFFYPVDFYIRVSSLPWYWPYMRVCFHVMKLTRWILKSRYRLFISRGMEWILMAKFSIIFLIPPRWHPPQPETPVLPKMQPLKWYLPAAPLPSGEHTPGRPVVKSMFRLRWIIIVARTKWNGTLLWQPV